MATQSRPNIVLILVDDMGFSDIGCYGSRIRTPHLDRLAAGGLRFTQTYNCARCCPTRASLLTGLYPHQAGVGHMVGDHGAGPAYQGYLRDDCVTVAEALRAGGYRTMLSGKWHVGGPYRANKPETWRPGDATHPTPNQRGFDEFYGMLGGGGSYFDPPYMARDGRIIRPGAEGGYYLTDGISDEAAAMIRRAAGGDRPFFLFVAYTAPHWPLHAWPEDIARYEGRFRHGWDAERTARHEELKGLGIVSARWAISPRDENAPPWDELDARRRDWEDLRMAVYAAQIDRMDQGVGRVLAALEETGQLDNTLIVFLSDNGGCAEHMAEDTSRPEPHRYDIPTPDGRPMRLGNIPGLRPGPDDTFMSYDLPWANASNSPFRRYKHWVHEGGIATPMIVHWPGHAGDAGGLRHGITHVIDLMPTFLAAAGVEKPDHHVGTGAQPMEGRSWLPALGDADWRRDEPVFFEHEGNRAVRDGQWKLVALRDGPWELYDMSADRTELRDLSAAKPDAVRQMAEAYGRWAGRVGVLPWPPGK